MYTLSKLAKCQSIRVCLLSHCINADPQTAFFFKTKTHFKQSNGLPMRCLHCNSFPIGLWFVTVAPKYNFCSLHPFFCSPHPFFCSPHPFFCSPHPFFCSPHHLFSSPHPFFCSLHPSNNCHSNMLGDTERRVFEWLIEET